MIDRAPFPLFSTFSNALEIGLFAKPDHALQDLEMMQELGGDKVAGLTQVHGNRTIIVRDTVHRSDKQADGMITDQRNLVLTSRWADCQNFMMYIPTQNIIGVLHAGWKGLHAGAIEGFIQTLLSNWKVDTTDIFVAAGPSLCTECSEFSDPEIELPEIKSKYKHGRCVDLQQAATDTFIHAGVCEDQFYRHPECTKCCNETYWSYRGGHKETVASGTGNAIAIMMK